MTERDYSVVTVARDEARSARLDFDWLRHDPHFNYVPEPEDER